MVVSLENTEMFFLLLFVCTIASISKLRPEGKKSDDNACFFFRQYSSSIVFIYIEDVAWWQFDVMYFERTSTRERDTTYLPTYYILYYLDSIEEDEAAGLDRKAATSDDLLVTTQWTMSLKKYHYIETFFFEKKIIC